MLTVLESSVTDDPSQRWIGSYNGRQLVFSSFFSWLYKGEEQDPKKRTTSPLYDRNKETSEKEITPFLKNIKKFRFKKIESG